MAFNHKYSVDLIWQQDRLGILSSTELIHQLPVATPPPFPKGMEGYWSPEHLFIAAVSSCFMTTFLAIADNSKLDFENFTCHAQGTLSQVGGKYQITEIHLKPMLTLQNEEDADKAERILQKTELACLISNSIKSKVIMTPKIEINKIA
jgi:peroxiredoxin-like protein